MYLKSIEITGFKSFANKTVMTFLPPTKAGNQSLTGVVGPNGSGKSNVSDAIRWVMGEQSMKQLRGKKASDIIFSGSASKGQMSVASVMMTLDNSDNRADIEYDELVIGRRIYRSGESEYVINGSAVRLIDLQILLAKAQFGQGSYAVIGQGMIDRLLLQSAADRKSFFDEASGIKEFQIKRHQAALRLSRTREHIEQADMLLHEISPRLKTLSRQVKKLEQRKEFEQTLREAQEQYYVTVHTHHQAQIDGFRADIETITASLAGAQETLTGIQQELAGLASGSSRQDVFASLQKTYQQLVQEKNTLERERAVLQGKLQTEYTKSGNHQMSWLEAKVSELKDQQQRFEAKVQTLESERGALQQHIETAAKEEEAMRVSRTTVKSEMSSLESQLLQLKSEQSAFQITGFRAVQAVLEARHTLQDVHGVVAQLGEVDPAYHVALDTAAGGRLASIVVEDEEGARACVEYLREGRYGVATFLPLSKVRSREVPSYVYDILQESGVHGLAVELVRYQDTYQEIFEFVFGSTVVVEDFATAKRIGVGRVRMVTLEGDLFETSGAVKGGYRKLRQHGISFADATGNSGIAERASECEEAISNKQTALLDMEREQERLFVALQQAKAELDSNGNKLELVLEQKHQIDTELATLEQELALSTMSPEQYSSAMENIADQKMHLDEKIGKVDASLKEAEQAIEQFNEEEEKKKQRVFALQDAMQQEQVLVNGLVDQKNTKQVALAKIETKQEDLAEELYQELRTSMQLVVDRGIEPIDIQGIEELQVEIQKLKYKLSLIGGIDQEVVDEYEQTKQRHDGLTTQLDDLKKAMNDLETLIAELDAVMKKRRNKAFKQIKKEFARYFELLFNGGKADLVEIYGEEDQEEDETAISEEGTDEEQPKKRKGKKMLKGIDVIACPPGKKIKHLQALSGGERTMTSIALMCAILKTNPSPFVVLDEVEAALDEANTLRVVNILKELSAASQFIVITHNKVTMHAMNALYGVTMGNDGVSHLLSVKFDEAVESVDNE